MATYQTVMRLALEYASHHMIIPSHPTTSNDSCDRLNSNQLSKCFTCPSVFQGNTTHPSNHLHLFNPTSTSNGLLSLPSSISHAASDTDIHSTFHLQRGSSGCQKSISDSSCSSKIRSTISLKSVSQIIKAVYTYVSPSTIRSSARSASWIVPSHRWGKERRHSWLPIRLS